MQRSISFDIVETTLVRRMREIGRDPQIVGEGCVATGYEHFHLHRGETQLLTVEGETIFFASVEINAVLKSRALGSVTISDLVSTQAASPDHALSRCAGYYMDVTFPALQALFDESPRGTGPATKMASYTQPGNRLVNWQVVSGQVQVLDGNHQPLPKFVGTQPAIALALDTLTDYLSKPRLHWCKLYGSRTPKGELIFGCSIDGQKSPPAEAEMKAKFQAMPDAPPEWEFRQFFTLRPQGAPDADMAAQLQQRAEADMPPRRSWWPFGKR